MNLIHKDDLYYYYYFMCMCNSNFHRGSFLMCIRQGEIKRWCRREQESHNVSEMSRDGQTRAELCRAGWCRVKWRHERRKYLIRENTHAKLAPREWHIHPSGIEREGIRMRKEKLLRLHHFVAMICEKHIYAKYEVVGTFLLTAGGIRFGRMDFWLPAEYINDCLDADGG